MAGRTERQTANQDIIVFLSGDCLSMQIHIQFTLYWFFGGHHCLSGQTILVFFSGLRAALRYSSFSSFSSFLFPSAESLKPCPTCGCGWVSQSPPPPKHFRTALLLLAYLSADASHVNGRVLVFASPKTILGSIYLWRRLFLFMGIPSYQGLLVFFFVYQGVRRKSAKRLLIVVGCLELGLAYIWW